LAKAVQAAFRETQDLETLPGIKKTYAPTPADSWANSRAGFRIWPAVIRSQSVRVRDGDLNVSNKGGDSKDLQKASKETKNLLSERRPATMPCPARSDSFVALLSFCSAFRLWPSAGAAKIIQVDFSPLFTAVLRTDDSTDLQKVSNETKNLLSERRPATMPLSGTI
jgi:hypothetical protein